MLYAKIVDDKVVTYPYTTTMLRNENLNTTFVLPISEQDMAPFNMFPVERTQKPEELYNNTVVELAPEKIDGVWKQKWEVRLISTEELLLRYKAKFTEIREKRTVLLTECDWTQLPDSSVDKQAWANYRQELRDLPSSNKNPFLIVWPIPPS